jgi:hypothetical protein
MTPKQQALYALMENAGYSIGCIHTALTLLGQSREALDDMIIYIEDHQPTEREVIEHIADISRPAPL